VLGNMEHPLGHAPVSPQALMLLVSNVLDTAIKTPLQLLCGGRGTGCKLMSEVDQLPTNTLSGAAAQQADMGAGDANSADRQWVTQWLRAADTAGLAMVMMASTVGLETYVLQEGRCWAGHLPLCLSLNTSASFRWQCSVCNKRMAATLVLSCCCLTWTPAVVPTAHIAQMYGRVRNTFAISRKSWRRRCMSSGRLSRT
jgi:hypothetical protein